ncbi:hypothetical protein EVAR_84498_1 [Eumeta japonica]|uniref:Uncharacterized protein n=1 Tax=Eumeta variegata TaxID=151549 RepID=A0A4C1UIF6_EUMVA|nr:hypothetical protein EVAR_84498_1 [Eumeta japonica]
MEANQNKVRRGASNKKLSRASLRFNPLLAMSIIKDAIYNWFTKSKRGRVNLCDEFSDGHPSKAVNKKNISAVHLMIETDEHVTYYAICGGDVLGRLPVPVHRQFPV